MGTEALEPAHPSPPGCKAQHVLPGRPSKKSAGLPLWPAGTHSGSPAAEDIRAGAQELGCDEGPSVGKSPGCLASMRL